MVSSRQPTLEPMSLNSGHVVHLEFASVFEMLDCVQVVSDYLGRSVGLDDDDRHWVGVAVRESVINAIKHGNRNDASKHVHVDFETSANGVPRSASACGTKVMDSTPPKSP